MFLLRVLLTQLDGIWILVIHCRKFISNGIQYHDEEVSSIVLVFEFRDTLGHVEEQLGTHCLEACPREVVMEVARIDLHGTTNLITI